MGEHPHNDAAPPVGRLARTFPRWSRQQGTPQCAAERSPVSSDRAPGRPPLPGVVYVLAAATFLMGTSEFVVVGLLRQIAADLHVSIPRAGLLVTAFAVGMIVGAPTMAVATRRLPRRTTLALAMVIFSLGHLTGALSTSFSVALIARVLAALATGTFWAVGAVVATSAAGPQSGSRAMGVMVGGLTLANVTGVPLGAAAGQAFGWQGPFWMLAILALVAALVMRVWIHGERTHPATSLRAELAAFRQVHVWLVYTATALLQGGILAAYSYISPLVTDRAGMPISTVPIVLLCFGVGAFFGTNAGGRFGDHWPIATAVVATVTTAFALFTLAFGPVNTPLTFVTVFALGTAGFALSPILVTMALKAAPRAPILAASLSTSSFNVGIAAGSWLAGVGLGSRLGLQAPPALGALLAILALVPLGAFAVGKRHTSRHATLGPS